MFSTLKRNHGHAGSDLNVSASEKRKSTKRSNGEVKLKFDTNEKALSGNLNGGTAVGGLGSAWTRSFNMSTALGKPVEAAPVTVAVTVAEVPRMTKRQTSGDSLLGDLNADDLFDPLEPVMERPLEEIEGIPEHEEITRKIALALQQQQQQPGLQANSNAESQESTEPESNPANPEG